MSSKKQSVLIHHHIFKNAGTSIQHSLKRFFGDDYHELDLEDHAIVTPRHIEQFLQQYPNTRVLTGHHICLPLGSMTHHELYSLVIIRHPLNRIPSIYHFERKQDPITQGAIKAKELDFHDYVVWRLDATPNMLSNYQTHYCVRTQQDHINQPADDDDLVRAKKNLKHCAMVGTVERFDETIACFNAIAEPLFPGLHIENKRLNTTSTHPQDISQIRQRLELELGSDMLESLEQKNRLDIELWKEANSLLEDRIQKQQGDSKHQPKTDTSTRSSC